MKSLFNNKTGQYTWQVTQGLEPKSFLLTSDIQETLEIYESSFRHFLNSRILISGGTGFVGRWLVSTLIAAINRFNLDIAITVLTRDKKLALAANPILDCENIRLIEHDVRNPYPKELGNFEFVFHAATPAQRRTGNQNSDFVDSVIKQGTLNLIEFLEAKNFNGNLLHTSSGAIYGNRTANKGSISEFETPNSVTTSRYGLAKLFAEDSLTEYATDRSIKLINARLFSFSGPLIGLNEHFAVGNFLSNARRGEPIEIKGNSQTLRSYLYPTDMVGWLVTGINLSSSQILHISGHLNLTMGEIAQLVQQIYPASRILCTGDNLETNDYVGQNCISTSLMQVQENVSLSASLKRWDHWLNLGGR